jgi:hypothetical protein
MVFSSVPSAAAASLLAPQPESRPGRKEGRNGGQKGTGEDGGGSRGRKERHVEEEGHLGEGRTEEKKGPRNL